MFTSTHRQGRCQLYNPISEIAILLPKVKLLLLNSPGNSLFALDINAVCDFKIDSLEVSPSNSEGISNTGTSTSPEGRWVE